MSSQQKILLVKNQTKQINKTHTFKLTKIYLKLFHLNEKLFSKEKQTWFTSVNSRSQGFDTFYISLDGLLVLK